MSTTISYCTIEDIRMKAGFEDATNLADRFVIAAREAAQAEIDTAVARRYTVPFNPVPEKIRVLTIKLAAYTLQADWMPSDRTKYALEAIRKQLTAVAIGETGITDENGVDLSNAEGVTGYFGTEPRMFSVSQRF